MDRFDYEQYRVVGLVEDKFGDNATIDVIGYCDDYLQVFRPLSSSEVFELFPTRGKIFAYKFNQKYKNLKGSIVCLCVQPSNNDGSENYVWDWEPEVIEYGQRIYPLKGIITEDGQNNYTILENNDLLNIEEDTLVYSAGRIYQISCENKDWVVRFWESSSIDIVTIDNNRYYVGISLPKHDGLVDITNDEQLANWYLSKVVKKNWSYITQAQSFRTSESFLREVLSSQKNLNAATIENRLKRLLSIDTSLSLTFESLKDIAESPWFSDVVNRSIVKEKDKLLDQLKLDYDEELIKIKEKYELERIQLEEKREAELNDLCQKIEGKKKALEEQEHTIETKLQEQEIEIELLDETVRKKQQVIDNLESSIQNLNLRKESIIQDYSIIYEVLSSREKSTSLKPSSHFSLEEINISDKPITRFQAYVKSLDNILKANGSTNHSPLTLSRMLVKYKVVLCPNMFLAQAFIWASHKCRYSTEYVSAKWSSFSDLWDNGLAYIVEKCYEEPEIIHFLLLQNINLSYLPNYMQPLADLQEGLITKFPATYIPYPSNLRILCTIAEEELIQLPASILRNFGCIDKSINLTLCCHMAFADDANLGYLTPEELVKEGQQDYEIQNMFEQYIDE